MVFLKLIPMIFYNLISLFGQPIFWLVVFIIWFQFRRMAKMKSEFFNVPEESVLRPTIIATAFGILGGVIGSFVLVFVGVSVLEVGIQYLWVLAILFMLIDQRFMCFAYAGGMASIVNYFFGYPNISIPQVMALVAVLHLVEALLILLSGHLGAVPIYAKSKDGRLVGGFNLQKFWPLPIVAMVAVIVPETNIFSDVIKMPEWWPLIKSNLPADNDNLLYMMVPVIAGLGYGDITLTTHPREKSRYSAFFLAVFSIILLGLAVLAANYPRLAILAALFGPLGHELVIFIGRYREFSREPKFVSPPQGIMILDVLTSSPLSSAGIGPGDIILSINGMEVNNSNDLEYALLFAGSTIEIQYFSEQKKVLKTKNIQGVMPGKPLGLIIVPDNYGFSYLDISRGEGFFKRLMKKLKGK